MRESAAHRRLSLALLALAALGCRAGAGPGARDARETNGVPRVVTLPPSAARYELVAQASGAVSGHDAPAVAQAVERAGSAHGLTLAPDARLGALAAWVAEQRARDGELPSAAAMDLAARQLGLVEPLPTISVIATNDVDGLAEHVFEETSAFFAQRAYTHYGGVVQAELDGVRCVLVLAQRFAALEPMARVIAVGTPIEISGGLVDGFSAPELAVTFPDGHVERGGAASGNRIQLRAETKTEGVYRVEILAEGTLGTTVVANFPIYVGVEPPTEVEIAPEASTAVGHEREALLQMLNDERHRAGVTPLVLDERLSKVALAHSEDMQAHGFVGHTSPTTGGAPDRIARAGVHTSLVLENIGRGYSLREVHEGLMASPGHRSNVVHPQATHVGIGVTREREHDRTAYLVTEVFIRVSAKLPDDAQAKLLADVNEAREARGLHALASDRELDAIAARAAARYFEPGAPAENTIMAQAQKELMRPSKAARRVGGLLAVVGGLDDLVRLDALANPKAKALGIGLAQGQRSDAFPNAICAVLLIGE